MFEEAEKRPELFSAMNIALAVVLHVVFFGFCALVAACSFAPKETVIPMDLTLVVHENLDGNDDEPPPMEKPQPQPPPPKPQPPKVETPPPQPPKNPPDALEKISDKKPEKKKEEKKEEKKPEKPKMTREERLKAMRESATVVKPKDTPKPKPVTNGRTGKKTLSDAEIQKRLMQGYKPGRTEQLATSEEQRCVSLIYQAFYERWEAPAYSSSLRDIVLEVTFDMNGRVADWRIKSSSGEAAADATVKRAAALVKQVYGLSDSFLRANKKVDVRFTVKPQ